MKTLFSMQEIAKVSKLTDKKVTKISKAIDNYTKSNLSQAILNYKLNYFNGGIYKNRQEVLKGLEITDDEYEVFNNLLKDRDLLVKAFSLILPNIDGTFVGYKIFYKKYKSKDMQAQNEEKDLTELTTVKGWVHKPFGINVLLENNEKGEEFVQTIDKETVTIKTVAVPAVFTKGLLTKCFRYFRKNFVSVLNEIKAQKNINIEITD